MACLALAALVSATGACGSRSAGISSSAHGAARALEIDPGASGGSVLACPLEPAATPCAPLARGGAVATPARIKTTRGARARVDLGDGATADLAGEASISIAADGRVGVEQGLVTLDDARARDVQILDHVARVGDAKTTLSVLVGAADR
ncbi:MAG TPA: hypothetical protein VGM56_03505, partial [Byssovorax sp.]